MSAVKSCLRYSVRCHYEFTGADGPVRPNRACANFPTIIYRQTAHRGRPPGRPETRLAPHLMQKTMSLRSQCAHWLWQSALPDYGLASGGSLSFCGERKGGKNAAKTNGFGILFADRIQQEPERSNHANLALQNSRLAFASSLRLHPRRALRLCWPGGTGETSASAVGRREGTPPYGGLSANGAQGLASRTT